MGAKKTVMLTGASGHMGFHGQSILKSIQALYGVYTTILHRLY